MRFGDIIYIKWIDALEKTGWNKIDEATKPDNETICHTISWFLKEDKHYIYVTGTRGETQENVVMTTLRIPKKWLLEKRKIRWEHVVT